MFKKTLPFTIGYAVLFLVMAALLLCYPKAELHILLNSSHTHTTDLFFKYFTAFAEWPLYIIGLVPLFFKRWWWTAYYATSEGVAALLIAILKRIFHMPRPLKFFGDDIASYLPIVDGVKLHHNNSFPSGHTSTFFIFVTVCIIILALQYARRTTIQTKHTLFFVVIQIALLLLAALGGYSRIYLSQHFLLDVFAGSIIGILVPFALLRLFKNKLADN